MSKEQLRRESFVREETPYWFKSEPRNCKKRIKYWLLSLWRYFSRNGPKIERLNTSINELKSEEITNWNYSRLILGYDMISVKRLIRLQEKAIRNPPKTSVSVEANTGEHKTNQNCTTNTTAELEPGYNRAKISMPRTKVRPAVIDSKETLGIYGKNINTATTSNSVLNSNESNQSYKGSSAKSLTKKCSEVEKSLFLQSSISESPKRKLPPVPTSHYTTFTKKKPLAHCLTEASDQELNNRSSTEDFYMENKSTEGNFEDRYPEEPFESNSQKAKLLTAKERNRRFLKGTQSGNAINRNINSNHDHETLTPSEYEIPLLSDEDNVRFYRMQKSRRNTSENSTLFQRRSNASQSS